MFKSTFAIAVLGICLFLAVPAYADGHGYRGSYHGGNPHHSAYHHDYAHHGGYAYRVYAPPVYRPRVIYPAPYLVPQPVYGPYGYYAAPGGGFYLQGRNFSLGVGF
jgi:hypothetical protein